MGFYHTHTNTQDKKLPTILGIQGVGLPLEFKHISVAATEGRIRSINFEVAAAQHRKTNRLLPGWSPYKMERKESEGNGGWRGSRGHSVHCRPVHLPCPFWQITLSFSLITSLKCLFTLEHCARAPSLPYSANEAEIRSLTPARVKWARSAGIWTAVPSCASRPRSVGHNDSGGWDSVLLH